jgi:hypothetical protein
MIYYILLPGDTEADCLNETNILGEDNGLGTFYPSSGFRALKKMIEVAPHILKDVKIKTSSNQTLTVEEFLDDISKLKIKN